MSQASSGHITLPKQLLEPGQTWVSCMREGDPSVCLREERSGNETTQHSSRIFQEKCISKLQTSDGEGTG